MPNVDVNGTVINFPDSMNPDELNSAVSKAASQMESQPKPMSLMDRVKGADATQGIQKAAPSNLLKMAGIASVNAPGVTNAVVNSIPGMGNPSQIMPSLQNIRKDPSQVLRAGKRIVANQAGAPLSPQEKTPALLGEAAGTAMELMAPSLGKPTIKPTGPFTAGLKAPGTALPGAFEKAGEELGGAKGLARLGDDPKEAARLRGLLVKPSGVQKVAEEAKNAMEAGKDVSVTHLLAYREALGKMQAEGGTFADDYRAARDIASQMLKNKAPDLFNKLEQMSVNYLAKGKGSFPWFTFALNPKVGLAKAANLPAVRNLAGAAVSPLTRVPGQIGTAISNAFQMKDDSN